MATQRPAFAKRERENKLKDKARAKAERRAARKATPRPGNGPPIAADDEVGEATSGAEDPAAATSPEGTPTPERSE
jgi:hypothetical protein